MIMKIALIITGGIILFLLISYITTKVSEFNGPANPVDL